MSPPSRVMFALSAPSNWRNVVAALSRRGAVKRMSLLSMMRRADSAEALAWTLRPLMAASSTWSKMRAGRRSGEATWRRMFCRVRPLTSAGVEAVGRHGPHHEVFAGDLREIAAGCVFGCAATAEGEVDVVEGDVFHDGSADTVEGDAGVLFAGVGGAGDFGFG